MSDKEFENIDSSVNTIIKVHAIDNQNNSNGWLSNSIKYIEKDSCNYINTTQGDQYQIYQILENDRKAYKQMFPNRQNCSKSGTDIYAYHIIQTFRKGVVSEKECYLLGLEFIKRYGIENYNTIIATHNDTENFHNHIIVSAYPKRGCENPKKLRDTKDLVEQLRKINHTIVMEAGIDDSYDEEYIKEAYKKRKGYTHSELDNRIPIRRKLNTFLAEAKRKAYTMEEYIGILANRGIEVNNDLAHKHITYRIIGESDRAIRDSSIFQNKTQCPYGRDELTMYFDKKSKKRVENELNEERNRIIEMNRILLPGQKLPVPKYKKIDDPTMVEPPSIIVNNLNNYNYNMEKISKGNFQLLIPQTRLRQVMINKITLSNFFLQTTRSRNYTIDDYKKVFLNMIIMNKIEKIKENIEITNTLIVKETAANDKANAGKISRLNTYKNNLKKLRIELNEEQSKLTLLNNSNKPKSVKGIREVNKEKSNKKEQTI